MNEADQPASSTNACGTTFPDQIPGTSSCCRQPSDVWPLIVTVVILFGAHKLIAVLKQKKGRP